MKKAQIKSGRTHKQELLKGQASADCENEQGVLIAYEGRKNDSTVEEKLGFIDTTVLRDSVTSKPELSNHLSSLHMVKPSNMTFKNGQAQPQAKSNQDLLNQNVKEDREHSGGRPGQNPQWKLEKGTRPPKAMKSKSSHGNPYQHKQFIPKSKSLKNNTVAKFKQHHTKLYQVKHQEASEQDDFLKDLHFLSSTKVAVQIEEDIAQKIQEFNEFRDTYHQYMDKPMTERSGLSLTQDFMASKHSEADQFFKDQRNVEPNELFVKQPSLKPELQTMSFNKRGTQQNNFESTGNHMLLKDQVPYFATKMSADLRNTKRNVPLEGQLFRGDIHLNMNKTNAESSTLVYNQSDVNFADSRYFPGPDKETLHKDASIKQDSRVLTNGAALSLPNEQVSSFKNSNNVHTISQHEHIEVINRGIDNNTAAVNTDQTAQMQSGRRTMDQVEMTQSSNLESLQQLDPKLIEMMYLNQHQFIQFMQNYSNMLMGGGNQPRNVITVPVAQTDQILVHDLENDQVTVASNQKLSQFKLKQNYLEHARAINLQTDLLSSKDPNYSDSYRIYQVKKSDGAFFISNSIGPKRMRKKSPGNRTLNYGAGFNPSTFNKKQRKQILDQKLTELKRSLEFEGFETNLTSEPNVLGESNTHSPHAGSTFKKQQMLSVRGHELSSILNKPTSPLRVVVQSTSKEDVACPDNTAISNSQLPSGLRYGINPLDQIIVPNASDVILLQDSMHAAPNLSHQLMYGFDQQNPDLSSMMQNGSMNYSVQNEYINLLAEMLIDEAKGIHKYKLDRSFYFRAHQSPEKLRKAKSTPKFQISYKGLVFDQNGNMSIGSKKKRKRRLAKSHDRAEQINFESLTNLLLVAQEKLRNEKQLGTPPHQHKINNISIKQQKINQEKLQLYQKMIKRIGKPQFEFALLDAIIQKEKLDSGFVLPGMPFHTHCNHLAPEGIENLNNSNDEHPSRETSKTNVISQFNKGPSIHINNQSELHEKKTKSPSPEKHLLTLDQQGSTLTRRHVISPGRKQIFSSNESFRNRAAQNYSGSHEKTDEIPDTIKAITSIQMQESKRTSSQRNMQQYQIPISGEETILLTQQNMKQDQDSAASDQDHLNPYTSHEKKPVRTQTHTIMPIKSENSMKASQHTDSHGVMEPIHKGENTDNEDNESPALMHQQAIYQNVYENVYNTQDNQEIGKLASVKNTDSMRGILDHNIKVIDSKGNEFYHKSVGSVVPITGESIIKLRSSMKQAESSHMNTSQLDDEYENNAVSMQPIVSTKSVADNKGQEVSDAKVGISARGSNENSKMQQHELNLRNKHIRQPNRQRSQVIVTSGSRDQYRVKNLSSYNSKKPHLRHLSIIVNHESSKQEPNSSPNRGSQDNVKIIDNNCAVGFVIPTGQPSSNKYTSGRDMFFIDTQQNNLLPPQHVFKSQTLKMNDISAEQQLQLLFKQTGIIPNVTRSVTMRKQSFTNQFSPINQATNVHQPGDLPIPIHVHTANLGDFGFNNKDSGTQRRFQSTNIAEEISVAEMSAQVMLDQHDIYTDQSENNRLVIHNLIQNFHQHQISPTSSQISEAQFFNHMHQLSDELEELQNYISENQQPKFIHEIKGIKRAINNFKPELPFEGTLVNQRDLDRRATSPMQFEVQGQRIYTIRQVQEYYQFVMAIHNDIRKLRSEVNGQQSRQNQMSIREEGSKRPSEQLGQVKINSKQQMIKEQQILMQIHQLQFIMQQLQAQQSVNTEMGKTLKTTKNTKRSDMNQITPITNTRLPKVNTVHTLHQYNVSDHITNINTNYLMKSDEHRDGQSFTVSKIITHHTPQERQAFISSGAVSHSGFHGHIGSSDDRALRSPRMNHGASHSFGPVSMSKDPSHSRGGHKLPQDQDYNMNMFSNTHEPDHSMMCLFQHAHNLTDDSKMLMTPVENEVKGSKTIEDAADSKSEEKTMFTQENQKTKQTDSSRAVENLTNRLNLAMKNEQNQEILNDSKSRTTIISKSQKGDYLKESKNFKASVKDSSEFELVHQTKEHDRGDSSFNKTPKDLVNQEGTDLNKTKKTMSFENYSEVKDHDKEGQMTFSAAFNLGYRFADKQANNLKFAESDRHLLGFQIKSVANPKEHTPKLRTQPFGQLKRDYANASPENSNDYVISEETTRIKQTGALSTEVKNSNQFNEGIPRSSEFKNQEDKANEITMGVDKIKIECSKKSRQQSNHNRMFMSSQNFCKNAPKFKLPKQFEQMKTTFKKELSKHFSSSIDYTTKTKINGQETRKVIDLAQLKKDQNSDHVKTSLIQTLNYHQTLDKDSRTNMMSPQSRESCTRETGKGSTSIDEYGTNRNPFRRGPKLSQIISHVHDNNEIPSAFPTNLQGSFSQLAPSSQNINYLIKNPTQNEISRSRLITNSHVLRTNDPLKQNKLQSAIAIGNLRENFAFAEQANQFGEKGLVPSEHFLSKRDSGENTAANQNHEHLQFESRHEIIQHFKPEKRIYSGVSQPSNTHASTAQRLSLPDYHLVELSQSRDYNSHNQNLQIKVVQNIRNGINQQDSLGMGRNSRPKTAKVRGSRQRAQQFSKYVTKDTQKKLTRLESAHDGMKKQNEQFVNSSSQQFLGSSHHNKESITRLVSGTGIVKPQDSEAHTRNMQMTNFYFSGERQSLQQSDMTSNLDINEFITVKKNGYMDPKLLMTATQSQMFSNSSVIQLKKANPNLLMDADIMTHTTKNFLPRDIINQSQLHVHTTEINDRAVNQRYFSGQPVTFCGKQFTEESLSNTTLAGLTQLQRRHVNSNNLPPFAQTRISQYTAANQLCPINGDLKSNSSAVMIRFQKRLPSAQGARISQVAQQRRQIKKGCVFKDQNFEARQRNNKNGVVI